MKPLTAPEVEKILLDHGYKFSRQKGSHKIYRHPGLGISVPVPYHGRKKLLPRGTFYSIVRQSKLSRELFKK